MPSVLGDTGPHSSSTVVFAHVAEIENCYCPKHSWCVSGVCCRVCLSVKGTGTAGDRGVYGHVSRGLLILLIFTDGFQVNVLTPPAQSPCPLCVRQRWSSCRRSGPRGWPWHLRGHRKQHVEKSNKCEDNPIRLQLFYPTGSNRYFFTGNLDMMPATCS